MDKSILVIGNGVWGKKINSLFQSWGFKVSQYGARNFLELNFESKKNMVNNQIIWIASTPDLQMRTISEISNFQKSSMVILEKPFFRDHIEKIQFSDILKKTNLNLRASSPWVYSDIWSKSKKKLLDLLAPLDITIKRSGPSNNKSILHYLNWLSHDVQLLADLFNSEVSIDYVNSRIEDSKLDSSKIEVRLSDGSKLEMSGGFSNSKLSSWVAQDAKGCSIEIDFYSKTLKYFGSDQILIESYKSPCDDNPLLNMMLNYLEQPDVKNVESNVRWQEVLI